MAPRTAEQKAALRRRLAHEFERYLAVTVFLFFFFGSIITYQRLILAAYDISFLDYGWALIKALVLGKVILIGEFLGLGNIFGD